MRLESNPSHLEFVDPVVVGATRAAQTKRQGPHANRDTNAAVPIVLHGDAAFPGQGVVAETLNLQALDGYTVGGTVHIIQNNQVGFTTDPDDSRSTTYASDMAKGFDVPIIHVNADDVAACISAVRLAFAFRQEFGHDVMIDPDRLPPLRSQRNGRAGLHAAGDVHADQAAPAGPRPVRQAADRVGRDQRGRVDRDGRWRLGDPPPSITSRSRRRSPRRPTTISARASTSSTAAVHRRSTPPVDSGKLQALNEDLLAVPDGFTVHPKLVKQLESRRDVFSADGPINWALAESLAFATLLTEGIPVRPDRTGRGARHVQPPPPGAARSQDRPGAFGDPASARRPGADGAAQQPAV